MKRIGTNEDERKNLNEKGKRKIRIILHKKRGDLREEDTMKTMKRGEHKEDKKRSRRNTKKMEK